MTRERLVGGLFGQNKWHIAALVLALAVAGVAVWPATVAVHGKAAADATRLVREAPADRMLPPWHPPLAPVQVRPAVPVATGHGTRRAVLMYHRVGPLPEHNDREAKALTVSTNRFEADLRDLRAAGCHCLTVAQAYELLSRRELPRNAVVLTFDDGYEDNYTVAWPLLRKYGYVATFDIVYDSLSAPEHMNRAQIRELAAAGNEIGSHTVSHAILTRLDLAHLRMEVTEPKQKLEALLGCRVTTFCYPEGRYDRQVLAAVRRAGYRLALTTDKGDWTTGTAPLEIPRFRMVEKTDLQRCLGGWLSPHRLRNRHRVEVAHV